MLRATKARRLEFYYDYSCPYAYLGSVRAQELAAKMGLPLEYAPMFLGGVFRAVQTPLNLMNVLSPAKAEHNAHDLLRWAKLFDVPLVIPPNHPQRTAAALRATLVTGCDPAVVDGFFRAYWVRGDDLADRTTLERVLRDAGHDAEKVLAEADSERVRNDLKARTDVAIGHGIFGAPAYLVDGEHLYWGQDRMHFVADLRYEDLFAPKTPSKSAPMKHTLDLYWDFSSPFGYLGSTQAEALAARTGAELTWRPMLLGGLFKIIGQADFPMATFSPAKQKYYADDIQRWAAYWGVPMKWPSRFPINTVKALRCYLALPPEAQRPFREAAFAAFWADDRDISDDAVLRELLGSHADATLAKIQEKAIKDELIACTDRAAKAGVFGAPTWVVDGKELFWGQDRIPLVERALTT
ncbi:MAG: 2-hydroxychromene-2-carboxylate isomerase [Polyangiaceae bacterium]|nr:2-hydroxychromene-2-carboxylate isomerase [Polyangiaceae bacterium]